MSRNPRYSLLSGIELNHSDSPESLVQPNELEQTFYLPLDYRRAGDMTPDLTGFQVCMDVEDAQRHRLEYSFEVHQFGDWEVLRSGTVEGTHTAGQYVWIDVYFDDTLEVPAEWLSNPFRISVSSEAGVWLDGDDNLLYRVLSASADSGVDFLGNSYRSMVSRNAVDTLSTIATDQVNNFWLSKPNPTRFAVESLYFDVRDGLNHATVVDRVLVDPITPGVYFTLYYSEDGSPASSEDGWEAKVWTPVYQIFKAARRQEHALSAPITAKYIKVEFSHLQPQFYAPGTFQQPITFKQHPKWVLDYFMVREAATDEGPLNSRVRVVFDAMELAYHYYLDDLRNDPAPPLSYAAEYMSDRTDKSDDVDRQTLDRILTIMKPYTRQPAERLRGVDSIVQAYSELSRSAGYPVESITRDVAVTTAAMSLEKMALIRDNNMPVTFFYIPAAHGYRVATATLATDKAFFVGVRELAFTRDHYTVASDQSLYVENLSDFTNVVRNDFIEQEYIDFGARPAP